MGHRGPAGFVDSPVEHDQRRFALATSRRTERVEPGEQCSLALIVLNAALGFIGHD